MKNLSYLVLFIGLNFVSVSYATDIGIGVHLSSYKGKSCNLARLTKNYGFNSVRIDYHWSDVEKIKGSYNESNPALESFIQCASKNKIKPLIILDYGNPLYGGGKPITEEQRRAFVNYAVWTVRHFGKNVDTYEVWNEWHLEKPRDRSQTLLSAEQYTMLVKAVYLEIKKISPSTKIIAGSFNPSKPNEMIWGEKLFKLGFLNYVDGISLHTYNRNRNKYMTASENLKSIDYLQEKIHSLTGGGKPTYITEIGMSDYIDGGISQSLISSFLLNYLREASKREYIAGVWLYDFINDGDNNKNEEDNFGILNSDLSEKPVAKEIKKFLSYNPVSSNK